MSSYSLRCENPERGKPIPIHLGRPPLAAASFWPRIPLGSLAGESPKVNLKVFNSLGAESPMCGLCGEPWRLQTKASPKPAEDQAIAAISGHPKVLTLHVQEGLHPATFCSGEQQGRSVAICCCRLQLFCLHRGDAGSTPGRACSCLMKCAPPPATFFQLESKRARVPDKLFSRSR